MLAFSSNVRFLRTPSLIARTAYSRAPRTLPVYSLCRPAFSTEQPKQKPPALRENIYTLPNFLTASRILACPVIGWSVLEGQFELATSLLLYAGLTDLVCPFSRVNELVLNSSKGRWMDRSTLQDELRARNYS